MFFKCNIYSVILLGDILTLQMFHLVDVFHIFERQQMEVFYVCDNS